MQTTTIECRKSTMQCVESAATVVFVGADMVDDDRTDGVLELVEASAMSYPAFLAARVAAAAVLTSPAVLFVVAVAYAFDVPVTLHDPGLLVVALLGTWLCCVGTGVALASLLTLSRAARTYQNVLTYPFYVLGGILIAPSALPAHLGDVSPVVFLSYSASLGRAAVTGSGGHWHHVLALFGLAAVHLALAKVAISHVQRRLKVLGTASYG